MSLADQSAETIVRGVIWASSAQGYMIPRLQFDPVVIASAKIEFCTAHNARTVLQNNLGPGSKIIIRRSGDVIPKFDGVILSTKASFPPTGTWVWDENQVHIKVVGEPKEVVTAKLQNFLKTLEIPGAGPATATALVDAGIQTPSKLWLSSVETLSATLGPKTGAALYANLRTRMATVSESTLMIASSAMPRGVKTTKLANLFAVEADPRKWHGLAAPDGWTAESFKNFLEELSNYLAWRETEISWIPFPIMNVQAVRPVGGQVICLTSFRDKELEKRAEERGHTVSATMSGKVTILLVPDGELKESEKVKAAKAKNIKILSRSQFLEQYLS
jgi:NAD-dependent DNA ligase